MLQLLSHVRVRHSCPLPFAGTWDGGTHVCAHTIMVVPVELDGDDAAAAALR